MTTSTEIQRRLQSLIPHGWFRNGPAALRDAVLGGLADAMAWVSNFVRYAGTQTRIATATGLWLDIASWDFFSFRLPRRALETDDRFRARILSELLRPRATREAITRVVTDLTGFAPKIVEPWHPGDCGAYDVNTLAYAGDAGPPARLAGYDTGGGGYGVGGLAYLDPAPFVPGSRGAGVWGDPALHNQVFVTVRRAALTFDDVAGVGAYDVGTMAYGGGTDGVPRLAGYDTTAGGWDQGPLAYEVTKVFASGFRGAGAYGPDAGFTVTDEDIFAAVAATTAAGVVPWVALESA